MSEQTPEPTTASDLHAGGDKPGNDYGATGGIGTSDDEGTGSDLNEGGGGADPNGPAVPDEEGAAAAQDGVQQAFGVAPQD